MRQRFLLAFLLSLLSGVTADSFINISFTFQGQTTVIQGVAHSKGYSFYGIPYAAPPVGDLRFKPAQAIKMPAFIDATVERVDECAQHNSDNITEDCLYLNILAPGNDTTSSTNPVYFWIHGGAFVGGNPNIQMGAFDNLINQGSIVMVSIYYRLGPFGFFTTRDAASPGNQALTDWIVALQWVQNYIRFFGGDPAKVTIGGQSAGAIATSFLTFTRKADNLFRASVMESGSAFLPSFMSYSDITRNSSMLTAVAAGCATVEQWNKHDLAENQKIVTCLRGKSMEGILDADLAAPSYDSCKWGMVPDQDHFPDRLETLALQRRPIPVLHGVNNLEWLGWVYGFILESNITGFTRQGNTEHLRNNYFMQYWKDPAAKKLYFDPVTAADDDHIKWCIEQMHIWDSRFRGVMHSLELAFIYDYGPFSGQPLTQGSDKIMKDNMGKLWANFIRTGNPTPLSGGIDLPYVWEPLESNNNYLFINEHPYMAQNFYPRGQFWMCNATAMNDIAPPYC